MRTVPLVRSSLSLPLTLSLALLGVVLLPGRLQAQPCDPELCDGLDNDCDTLVDEDFPVGEECTVGQGACRRSGTLVCTPDLLDTQCNAVAGSPVDETCANGIDDDCDGLTDEPATLHLVAAANDNGQLFVAWYSPLTRTFGGFTRLALPLVSGSRGVAVNDFDGDGLDDVLLGRLTGSTATFHLLTQTPCRTFVYQGQVASRSGGSFAMDLATGDLNGDGVMDFVSQSHDANVIVFLGDGRGGFSALPAINAGGYSRGLDLGDFNRDGILDLVRGRYSDGLVHRFLGIGDGTFGAAALVGDVGGDPYAVTAADFDGDGDDDVLAGAESNGDIRFYRGNGDGTFVDLGVVASLDAGQYASMDSFDFDGDGFPDIVQSHYASPCRLLYLRNNGNLTFAAGVQVGTLGGVALAVAAPLAGPPGASPRAVLAPRTQAVAVGENALLDASSSLGTINEGWWDFGDGTPPQLCDPADCRYTASHAYAAEGTYHPSLSVEGNGWAHSAATSVRVLGDLPEVLEDPVVFGEDEAAGGKWNLTLTGSDFASDDGSIVRWGWEFQDGLLDGFEDGDDAGWERNGGSWSVTSSGPLAGSYSYSQSSTAASAWYLNLNNRVFYGDIVYDVDVRMLPGASERVYLLFAARNVGNLYYLALRGETYHDLLLYRRSGESDTLLQEYDVFSSSPSYPIDHSKTYHLRVAHTGSRIQVWLDGVLCIDVTDSTFKKGQIGLATYQTPAVFDGVWVREVSTAANPSHVFYPGSHEVQLTVEDEAGQTTTGTIPITAAPGLPPSANPGGPYTVPEGAAQRGGFPVTLDGTGSLDPDGSSLTYGWNLGTDTFDGNVLDQGKWLASAAGVVQSGEVVITGNGSWGQRYLFSRDSYARAEGLAFEARVWPNGAMVGWKKDNETAHYNNYVYALYFNTSGQVLIYEDGSNRATAINYSVNTWYDVRIVLKAAAGATYYLRPSGASYWTLAYDSSYATTTPLRRGADVVSNTFRLDNVRELAVGPTPSYRLYGTGVHPVALTVTDPAGQTATAATTVTNLPGALPVADAGPDRVLGESYASGGIWTAALNGSASTDDNGIYRYEWDFSYDAGAGFVAEATGVTASTTFAAPGVYTVALRVTDHARQTSVDPVEITVVTNAPPVAAAGPDQLLDETAAVDGDWSAALNGSASTDDKGIYRYEWDFTYDAGAGFIVEATGVTATAHYTVPGTYTVALRVTDHALQTALDTLEVTVTKGDAPVAEAGGPYSFDETTGNAQNGGFTVQLDGTGSTDDQCPATLTYLWDLGSDTFAGTSINGYKWTTSAAGVSQNNGLVITGASSWGSRYAFSKDTYARAKKMAMEATVRTTGGNFMIGFKNTDASNGHYNQYPYALYFSSGTFFIYENGTNRNNPGRTYSYNTDYEVRIELKAGSGARFYYRTAGAASWILLYNSPYVSTASFRRGLDVYSGTVTVKSIEELVAGPTPSYRLYGLGPRSVALTVYDQAWQASTDLTTVTLLANDPPVVSAGADVAAGEESAFEGTWTLGLNGSASDDHGVMRCEWDFDYDGSFQPSGSTGTSATYTYPSFGIYVVALRCLDHALQSTLDTATVTLSNGAPPVADAGEDVTTEGLWPVSFDGSGSTDDVAIARYEWDFGDGQRAVGPLPQHIYWAPGVYQATLTVYDNAAQFDRDTVTVTVGDGTGSPPPTARAGGPYLAAAGGPPAYFDGGASSDAPGGGIVKYLWDVDAAVDSDGDGNFANDVNLIGRRPFHAYAAVGSYTATLTVVDGAGHSSSDTATVNVVANLAPEVICVPASGGNPEVRHSIRAGVATRLKAIVRDAGNLTYQWSFGDGTAASPTTPGSVSNKYIVEASHTYPAGAAVGTLYDATLNVWDASNLRGSCSYTLEVKPDTLDTRTDISIDEGLWWLHRNQNRTSGYWQYDSNQRSAATASAVQAFLIQGHMEENDPHTDPYVENVNVGLGYMFTRLAAIGIGSQTYGNPDSNGNGRGINVSESNSPYQGGMVIDALAATRRPLGFAPTGPSNVKGLYYHQIVTDMLDAYSWGQYDHATVGGGWRYSWNSAPDNSACQWWAIGAHAAEQNFSIYVPRWVIDRNLVWLGYSSDGTGWGYTGAGNGVATTPSGMVQLAYDGVRTTDSRWRKAEDYLASRWLWQSNNFYSLFALLKAFRLARPAPVERLGLTNLDWYNDNSVGVRRHITGLMYTSGSGWGSWSSGGYGGQTLDTAWAVIMLTPALFVQPPDAEAGADVVWAFDTPLHFDASRSHHPDPARRIVRYEWDFDGNGRWDFSTANPADPAAVWTYPDPHPDQGGDAPQVFQVRLRVTDDNVPPQTDVDVRQVTAAEPPHAPFARTGGPYDATAGLPFTLDASGSFDLDPFDAVQRYEWDLDHDGVFFGNAGDVDLQTAQAQAEWTYGEPGTYNIALRVWDLGAFNPLGCTIGDDCVPMVSDPPDFTTVAVHANLPPIADAGGPYAADEGEMITLDGSGTIDPNGDPLQYFWDLDGDNVYDVPGELVSGIWSNEGSFTIGLRATDTLLEDTDTAAVAVSNVAPQVTVGGTRVVDALVAEGPLASFTDPGVADMHTPALPDGTAVDWGDGNGFTIDGLTLQEPAGGSPGSVSGGRTYPDPALYSVGVRVCDDAGACGTASFAVDVVCGATGLGVGCSLGIGACERAGTTVCNRPGRAIVCNAVPGQPSPEICDFVDNNCNGTLDDVAGLGDPCREGIGACERGGQLVCDYIVQALDCDAVPGEPTAEACDLVDNDCDGAADEEADLGFTTCGLGECVHTVDNCIGGVLQHCDPLQGQVGELCDLLDNDCDGTTDEEADLGFTTCGLGECAHTVDSCVDGVTVACDPMEGVASEQCDLLDNDCDGTTDEEADLGFTSCGLGVCQHTVDNCVDGLPMACDPMDGAGIEACNLLDDDCDGVADEEADLGFTSCGLGECAHTVDNCVGGVVQLCDPLAGQVGELCDLLDNDCDGTTDEEADLGFTSCGLGECEHTVDNCVDGVSVACDPMEGAAAEACNLLDDDCDGTTDEEADLGFTTCGLGECVHTVDNCVGGVAQVCDPLEGAAAEVCDGIDNDCDGVADEGLGSTICGLGACEHTVDNCVGGVTQVCDPMEGATPEICDGIDNDCDGVADEGLGSTICGLGACEHTVDNCVGGVAQVCDPLEGAAAEVCDGIDNDCDGVADEGLGSTTCGLGECVHTVDNCVGGVTQVCDPMEGAAAEVCDGIDNDCDDDVDEDLGTTTCGVGPCAHTVDNCVGGVAQECDPFAGATPEICDGIDNDCNPHSLDGADEEPPANTRDAGVCAGSLQSCQDGRWQDDYSGVPGYEVPEASCDGLDNDCNGLADDPFGPDSCSFTCTAGGDVWTGHDGLLACCGNDEGEANPYQAVEAVCNDLSDNDCNGQVDCQDAACATDPHCVDADGDGHFADMDCADDDPAVHPGATEFCTIDGLFVERDCDPDTVLNCLDFCGDLDDDGFVTEETWESWGGELQSVVCPWVTGWGDCNDGNALVHPGAEEECDGQDNDCDGLVDEGCNTLHCPQLPQAVNYVDNGIPLACPGLDPGPSRLLLVDSSCHPLANVRVNLRTAANGYITYRRTNREGVADFSGYHGRAIPDHFEVGFRGATFSTAAGSFAGGAGVQTWDYTLTLLDSDCNPIPNVRVNLRRSNDSFVTHARTNGAGIASFEVLPGARLKLEVEYRGGRWRSEANTAQIDVVLSTERFELLLLDSHGAPLDNVRVNLRPANGCYVTSARTGVAGVAGFQVLPGVPLLFEVSYHGATYRTLPSVTHLREVVRTLPFGVVLTSSEGLPIEGVRVDLRRGASNGHVTRTRTGPDGVASFEVLPGALQRLQLTYHGATWRSGPITVDQPTLLPLQTYSFGMLLLTSDEQPIENARVVLERADGSQVTSARTGVDGVAAFEVLPGATMRLEGYYHGSRYQTAATTLVEDTLLTVHTMRFGVVLTDSQGEPIENARVNLRRANGRYVTSLRTDALGVAAFQVFPGACMLLEVVYNGSQFRTARTCLVEDTMIAIQLPVLVPVSTNRLGLLLLDSLDQPLRNVRVDLLREDGRYVSNTRTNADGLARFQVLPGARHRLAVVYNGATWQSEVLQAAQQPLTVLNTLPLELLLLDSGGLPIDDARVELHRASGGHVTTTRTGNDGVAGFEVLPGATMLLEAEYNGAAYRTEPVLVEQPEQLAVSTLSFSLLLGDSQGQPITDVRVNLRQGSGGYIANTRTGEDGEAGFEVLPGATVLLEADYHGDTYRTAAVQVTQDTQLGLQTLPLQLLLVDSQGQPIADVRVNLRRASGSYVANALTGEDGVASFEVLPGAEMLLEADLLGTTSRTAAVTVDQATQLQLQTLSSGLLLLDSQGSPIADVAVELQRSNGSRLATTRTGEDGVAAFELLPGATMRLEADLLGKAFRSAVTTITENTRLQVQTAAISVLLTRAGAPIASQPVDLLPASGNGRLLYLRTSDEGLVTFEVLPGTTYRVRASYNGVTWTSERLTAPAEVMRSF